MYATALIILTPEYLLPDFNPKSTTCHDTGCRVTLVNKTWLLKRLPIQKINIMSTSLKVKEIRASKHESREFAALSLYFLDKNNGSAGLCLFDLRNSFSQRFKSKFIY